MPRCVLSSRQSRHHPVGAATPRAAASAPPPFPTTQPHLVDYSSPPYLTSAGTAALAAALAATTAPLVSVDTPSGWHVERGPPDAGAVLRPAVLVSLTAPKKCAACFRGRHYVGGRFVPPFIREKYDLRLPPYPGVAQIQELEAWGGDGEG